MLKITTRIFAAGVMAALLIALNTGALACENCSKGAASSAVKTVAKITKPMAKTIANAKIAPKAAKSKVAKKSATKIKAAPVAGAKNASEAIPMCPMCQPAAKAGAKS